MTYWYLSLAILALALFRLVADGPDATWLGAIVAALPFVALFLWLGSGRAAPRSSRRMPVLTLVTLAGAALAAWGYFAGGSHSVLGIVSALVASAGFLLFVNWYSLFNRPLNRCIGRGERLPAFEAKTGDGRAVSTADLAGKPAVLMFFRGNWCPICMAQVKELAAGYRALLDRGARVVLVSPQPHDLTERVAGMFDVGFEFWVDEGAAAARQLGIVHEDGVPAGSRARYGRDTVFPTVLIVDADGTILYADQSNNFRVRPEPRRFVEVLAEHGY